VYPRHPFELGRADMSTFIPGPSRPEIVELAIELWGQPTERRHDDIRFGKRGSKSVKPSTNEWFDHEANDGGGYIALWRLARPSQPLPSAATNGQNPPQLNVDVAYDYRYADRTLAYQVVRTITGEPRFLQRRPNGLHRWIWNVEGIRRVPYHLPELLSAPRGSVIYIPEGEKDVDRLRRHGRIATCNPGGAAEHKNKAKPYRGKWLLEFGEHLRGQHVRILADNDAPGEAHALDIARKLQGIAASVRIIRLPNLAVKGDVSDWLDAGHTIKELDHLADETLEWDPLDEPGCAKSLESDAAEAQPSTGRTNLQVIKGEYVSVAERIEAIATATNLPIYSHGEALCRPVTEHRKRHDGQVVTAAALRNYNVASLRRALDHAMEFSKFDARRRTFVLCEPPADVINMVLAGEQRQVFPPIRGIIGTPIIRPNRTIIATPGYDAETGYFLVDAPRMPEIPAAPTKSDAERALAVLADLISEFPFVDDVSKSVAYSGLITPLVRAACDVVPGHLFTAPKPGSGKSLLVDTAAAIATGERAYAILAHRNQEEQDKQLTGALLEARQIIALDNLTGDIESAVLAQVTERELVSVRPLGTSRTVSVTNAFNVYLTGNNVTIGGDNTRRLLNGRIDPQVENPLDRSFAKSNPVERVFAARGEFVAACLTIVLAYIAQGCPCGLRPIPSYGPWSELVREPLVWLGQADPTDSMRAAADDDPNNATLAALMAGWPATQDDWTCAELIDAAIGADAGTYPRLAEALKPVARDRRGMFDAAILGNYLRQNRDKIVDGQKISRRHNVAHGGATRWFLARAGGTR
jgi:putative DNA primase/helicase